MLSYSQVSCLRRAVNMFKEANNAKAVFIANVSHELRTPLFSILGWTELLRDTPVTPTQSEMIQTIKFCSDHMLGEDGNGPMATSYFVLLLLLPPFLITTATVGTLLLIS
eukprot:TRINITY_DN9369_c0_g1_i9.p1 TRINITY_DN9369_c0_g1~~TRINITY_DN9369_c0_g1_i9.p1  ORF type:complete len:110 (-),score=10.98 TRINITY_DN9369_c0_g1_i9:91-420(-)